MAKTSEHAFTGALTGVSVLVLRKRMRNEEITFGDLLFACVTGGSAAILPDVLEPATNPNHRDFMHSKFFGGTLGLVSNNVANNQEMSETQKDFLLIMAASYGSHLLLDSMTPKGLP